MFFGRICFFIKIENWDDTIPSIEFSKQKNLSNIINSIDNKKKSLCITFCNKDLFELRLHCFSLLNGHADGAQMQKTFSGIFFVYPLDEFT